MPPVAFRNHPSPKIQFLKKRCDDMMTLAAEKVTRHLQHSNTYPLPSSGKKSLERALFDVVMELPNRKRNDFIDRFKHIPAPGSGQRMGKYGDLHTIDLHSAVPIAEQIKNIGVPENMHFTTPEIKQLESLLPLSAKPVSFRKKIVPRQAVATQLDFIVDSITCISTNDIRKDEINLGGFATDPGGGALNKDPFFVSKFKKGDTVPLGAKGNLFSFSLDAGSTGGNFPLSFVAGIFINEEDLFSNQALARKLSIFLSIAGIAIEIAGLLVAVLIPPVYWIGLAILLFGGATFVFGNDLIPLFLTDDVGIPATDTLVFDTPPPPGETFTRTLELPFDLGNGFVQNTYTASVRWVTR